MTEFEEIYARYLSSVYNYAWRLTHDKDEAEELTAETFCKALKNLSRYDESKADIRIWLCQIAKNTWISQCRKQGRELPLEFESGDFCANLGSLSIERALEDKESAQHLHTLLHRMDEPFKEIFALRVLGELPFAQIAELFGQTESWARVTFMRAKRKLQQQMEEYL